MMEQQNRLTALDEHEMTQLNGGGDGGANFVNDLGNVVGAAAGAFMVFGAALYRSGGLFGKTGARC